jgi:ribose/xylose/arabinose/galactoside ABC-type transport system permease subunit
MMRVARGLALLYTGGKSQYDFATGFRRLGSGFVAGIPTPVIVAGVLFVVLYLVLRHTTWGRRVYAVGANPIAARFSGFNVRFLLLTVYVAAGVLAGIAGLIYTAYVNAAEPTIGDQFPTDAIAAVVIGGTPFSGGIGGVAQTMAGAIIIAVLNTILNLVNISSYWQVFAKGLVIIVALVFDLLVRRYLGRTRLAG